MRPSASVLLIALFCASLSLAASPLTAGVAKAVITPQDATPRIGVMGEPMIAVDHDLYARALTLNDGVGRMVLLTYDLNCLDVATPILRARCQAELGLDPARLIILSTHNHQAPIQIVPANFDYGRWLAERSFALIQEAIANESGPARVFFGSGECAMLGKVGPHEIDAEVQLLKVERDGTPAAIFFTHPTHPMHTANERIDVGHCGYAVDFVEAAVPGAQAMYSSACGGNQFVGSPLIFTNNPIERVKESGRKLADAALAILAAPMKEVTGPLSASLDIIPLPLAAPMPESEARALAAGKNIPLDIGYVPYPHPDRGTNWLRALLAWHESGRPFPTRTTDLVCTDDGFLLESLPEPRTHECRYEETIIARIGPMIFVAMQGEVCAPIGQRIKAAFREKHPIFVTAYMGEHNLYIPTRFLVEHKMYQGTVIQTQYASPVPWAPEVEEEMGAAVIRLVEAALAK